MNPARITTIDLLPTRAAAVVVSCSGPSSFRLRELGVLPAPISAFCVALPFAILYKSRLAIPFSLSASGRHVPSKSNCSIPIPSI